MVKKKLVAMGLSAVMILSPIAPMMSTVYAEDGENTVVSTQGESKETEKPEDGSETTKPKDQETKVAEVGKEGYTSLKKAVEAANEADNNATIKLLSDAEIGEGDFIVTNSMTLDLNGHTLTGANGNEENIVVQGGTFTLIDSTDSDKLEVSNSEEETGKLVASKDYKKGTYTSGIIEAIGEDAKVVMESGNIEAVMGTPSSNGQFGIFLDDGADCDINGGTIKAGWYAVSGNGLDVETDSQINISGGTLKSAADYAVYLPQEGTTTITGGKIYGEAGGICIRRGKLNIKGGDITSVGEGDTGEWSDGTGNVDSAALSLPEDLYGDVTVNISGGRLTAVKKALINKETDNCYGGKISITGGEFLSKDESETLGDSYLNEYLDQEYVAKEIKDEEIAKGWRVVEAGVPEAQNAAIVALQAIKGYEHYKENKAVDAAYNTAETAINDATTNTAVKDARKDGIDKLEKIIRTLAEKDIIEMTENDLEKLIESGLLNDYFAKNVKSEGSAITLSIISNASKDQLNAIGTNDEEEKIAKSIKTLCKDNNKNTVEITGLFDLKVASDSLFKDEDDKYSGYTKASDLTNQIIFENLLKDNNSLKGFGGKSINLTITNYNEDETYGPYAALYKNPFEMEIKFEDDIPDVTPGIPDTKPEEKPEIKPEDPQVEVPVTEGKVEEIDGEETVKNDEGEILKNQVVKTDDGKIIATNEEGQVAKNEVVKVEDKEIVANEKGEVAKNEVVKVEDKEIVANEKGEVAKNEVVKVEDKEIVANESGEVAKDEIVQVGEKKVLARPNGELLKDKMRKHDGNWYMAREDGSLVANKMRKHGDDWYLLRKDGTMASDCMRKYKNDWYLLRKDGSMASNCMRKYKGHWYMLNKEGSMLTGTTVTYKGVTYTIDKNGYCK